jgi:hypothetical protein
MLMSGIAPSEPVFISRFETLSIEPSIAIAEKLSADFNLPPAITLQELLSLSWPERNQIVQECLPGIVADFNDHPELREFELDCSDWELEDD